MDRKDKVQKIIENSLQNHNRTQREFSIFGKMFYLQQHFHGEVEVQNVISKVEKMMPPHLFDEVDMIIVDDFDFLRERELEALYKDGAIYLTPFLYSDHDVIENIVHEVSHSIEERLGRLIYGDGKLRKEFQTKRDTLARHLGAHDYDTSGLDFQDVEYDLAFDEFLHKEVGYANLRNFTDGIFHRPYAATSIREYWAAGFEDYFIGEASEVARLSPVLFNIIEEVVSYED